MKASLPDSSTTIGVKAVQQILGGLCREHPAARRREVITNRTQTTQLAKELANPNSQLLKAGEHFVQRKESSQQLTAKLLHTIGNLRAVGAGGDRLRAALPAAPAGRPCPRGQCPRSRPKPGSRGRSGDS